MIMTMKTGNGRILIFGGVAMSRMIVLMIFHTMIMVVLFMVMRLVIMMVVTAAAGVIFFLDLHHGWRQAWGKWDDLVAQSRDALRDGRRQG